MNTEQVIICAAVKYEDGTILVGPRHFDRVMVAQYNNLDKLHTMVEPVQGFIDQFGTFLTREEALIVATNAGQINTRRPKTNPLYQLFSEDLY